VHTGGSDSHLIILAVLGALNSALILWNTILTRHAKRKAGDAANSAGAAASSAATAVENTNGKLDVRIRSAVRSELAVVMKDTKPTFERMIRAAIEDKA
jgi:hypothetical protein